MGKIFTLTAGIKAVITNALDDLITELGKDCRVVYPTKNVPCGNCVWDSVNQVGGLIWKTGGLIPFPNGTACPNCNGRGMKAQEYSEVLQFLCAWEPKQFYYPIPNLPIRSPGGFVQIKGYLTDLPKIIKCDHIVFEIAIEGITRQKYKLWGEAGDRSNIIQKRYFTATFERVSG